VGAAGKRNTVCAVAGVLVCAAVLTGAAVLRSSGPEGAGEAAGRVARRPAPIAAGARPGARPEAPAAADDGLAPLLEAVAEDVLQPVLVRPELVEQWLRRISFPRDCDGRPRDGTPEEDVADIVAVHKRYWQNYARLAGVEMDYVRQSYRNGVPGTSEWDFEVHVELRPGEGMRVEGTYADGKPLSVGLDRKGERLTRSKGGDWSSFMQSIVCIHFARPDACRRFSAIRSDVGGEEVGLDGERYDVLINMNDSFTMDPNDPRPIEYWFNRRTGMLDLERGVYQEAKDEYGYYPYRRFEYVEAAGASFPRSLVIDSPHRQARIVEQCRNIRLWVAE
jgi:hypothetical protein